MIIGIIGRGMVGNAIYKTFLSYKHEMLYYDPAFKESRFEDILISDIVFIAVPTLADQNGNCDLSILLSVMELLKDFKGIICIKSTIVPGTTDSLIKKYCNDKICYSPEFLKERSAFEDFKNKNPITVIGTTNYEVEGILKKISSPFCGITKKVKPIEAELTKYFQNVYNVYRILFANGFYEVCKAEGADYNCILDTLIIRGEVTNDYLECNENLRGPSGPCLVKDSLAFNNYTKKINLVSDIFQNIVNDLNIYPKTVIKGTRP